MWHPGEAQPDDDGPAERRPSKARSILLVVAILVAAFWFVSWQTDKTESNAAKEVCELVHGAGNCVRSGGEWVRRGSSPLFGP